MYYRVKITDVTWNIQQQPTEHFWAYTLAKYENVVTLERIFGKGYHSVDYVIENDSKWTKLPTDLARMRLCD